MHISNISNLFKSDNDNSANAFRVIENKIKDIIIKTLYFLGMMFMFVAVNASLKYPCIMNATALPIGMSILCFKSAYSVYTKGVLEFPKISLNTGTFQIGLV